MFSQSVVGQFTPKWKSLARLPTANSEKPLQQNSAVSGQVYVHVLLVQHLYSGFFQYIVWYGPTSETASMQRRQKNYLKYTDFTELKKITSRSYSNCSNYSSLFSSLSNFVAVRSLSLKQICSLLYKFTTYFTFYFIVNFSKEKSRAGFWWVLLFF